MNRLPKGDSKLLILTEKPSVAKDFAKALNCSFKSLSEKTGFYSDGKTVITNCIGHLFRLPDPEFYDDRFKSWKEYPCIPLHFSYQINPSVQQQSQLVLRLLKEHNSDTILIATDADREGEVIARECLMCSGLKDFSRIKRFWVSQALTPEVVLEGIKEAKPLDDYSRLAANGFGRQHSDWLTGYNFTRYVSVAANKKLSIGRVKTAVLSAIDTRCNQIENFTSEKYFEYYASFGAQRCAPSCKGIYFTDNSRTQFNDKSSENELKSDIGDKVSVLENKSENKETPAPQLYNLNAVQKDAFMLYGYSAEDTLKIIQKLYEEYKCVSYPRTPSKVMGTGNVELVKNIFIGLAKTYSDFSDVLKISDISLNNKRCFNDEKLEAHHALIPLKDCPQSANESEKNVYNLILNRFKVAFASPYVFNKQTIVLTVNNHNYKITGNSTVDPGWKRFASSATLRSENEDEAEQTLENIDWNNLTLQNLETKEKWTKPPKYFNEASILSFMENPKSQDENHGKLIGLGTQATRHTFIPELLKNGYIKIEKKNILTTELGKIVINAVRNSSIKSFADISQTTNWEKQLEENPELFENNIKSFITEAVKEPFKIELQTDENEIKCPVCGKGLRLGTTKSGYRNWYCTGYKYGCQFKLWENFNGTKLSENDIRILCSGKRTSSKKFTSQKTGKEYKAHLLLDSNNQIKFEFDY
ncbi:DNA topoisomerase [Treponema sp.]|uniref:DNA topoisomerase n=1 Tax=Treponema sp. TaxID=166 RepID=UPI003FD89DC2